MRERPALDEQQLASIINARHLLMRLVDHTQTPRVPRPIRAEARALLRRFPRADTLRDAAGGRPASLGAYPE